MGARRVLREALQDLMALPEDAWERSVALPLLVHFGYETNNPSRCRPSHALVCAPSGHAQLMP